MLLSFHFAGSVPGSEDIEPFTIFPGSATSATVDLLTPLPHGLTVYSTLICINNAGLHSVAYSDGVTVLTSPPLARDAFFYITSTNLTRHESRGGFLPSSDAMLRWGGFVEPSGAPLAYEVRLTEAGSAAGNWTNVGHTYSLTLSDLSLEVNVTHVAEVRAVNLAGLASDLLMENFTIVASPPQVAAPGIILIYLVYNIRVYVVCAHQDSYYTRVM